MSKHVSTSKKIAAGITVSLMLGSFVPAQAGPMEFFNEKANSFSKFIGKLKRSKVLNNIRLTTNCFTGAAAMAPLILWHYLTYPEHMIKSTKDGFNGLMPKSVIGDKRFIDWINDVFPTDEDKLLYLKCAGFVLGLALFTYNAPQLLYNAYKDIKDNKDTTNENTTDKEEEE